jgi:hypothetical protein
VGGSLGGLVALAIALGLLLVLRRSKETSTTVSNLEMGRKENI